jgi:hypothetical protein
VAIRAGLSYKTPLSERVSLTGIGIEERFAAVRGMLAVILVLSLVGGCSAERKITERVAYWTHTIDQSIPPGTAHSAVVQWAQSHKYPFEDWTEEHKFGGTAETIPDYFPCSETKILAYVLFDASGRSIRNDVTTFSVCL